MSQRTPLRRATFREILQAARSQAAESAWRRAVLASKLRHGAMRSGKGNVARTLAQIKQRAIQRTAAILPEQVTVTIDNDYRIGLLSVRWDGHKWLHLPAQTPFPQQVAAVEPVKLTA